MKKRILFCFVALMAIPGITFAQAVEPQDPHLEEVFYKGNVIQVIKEDAVEDFGIAIFRQVLSIEIADKDFSGANPASIVYEVDAAQRESQALQAGDRVIVSQSTIVQPDGSESDREYVITDVNRLRGLWWLLAAFVGVTLLFAGRYGARAFLGLILSFVVIIWYVVPGIVGGGSPLWVSFSGSVVIASTALFLAHGFKRRTVIAFVSTIASLLLALVFSYLSVKGLHLFGVGSEEAFFLQFSNDIKINLQGLLLGGIIIGTLGVLDDVTTAQAATVEEIQRADAALSMRDLYERGISVGREHIISLVNTLVLAYTGASLPLLILFQLYEKPIWVTLNSELIMEEVVRMIVGSMTLIVAVPITTLLAAYYFGRTQKGTNIAKFSQK